MPSSQKLPSRRTGRQASLAVFILLLLAAFFVAAAGVTRLLAPVTSVRTAPAVLVTVPAGANVRTIGALLARRGLVRSSLSFTLAARLDHVSDKMQAGHYELSPAMPPRQIALLIALGHTASDVVVIPEGFTVAQIARRLALLHKVDEHSFLALARTQGRTFQANGFRPPSDNLEGYLYPDTYRLPKSASEREIITQMLQNFQARVLAPRPQDFAQAPGGLPGVLTLASLVEREAEADSERPHIASVLTNRLRIGMRLQCDASVQYALPEHKTRLLFSDLRVNSPYNTYLHAGLPPTPICNPGLPSILAALHPGVSDDLFYVARGNGHHIFSPTLAAHDRAIAQVRALAARD